MQKLELRFEEQKKQSYIYKYIDTELLWLIFFEIYYFEEIFNNNNNNNNKTSEHEDDGDTSCKLSTRNNHKGLVKELEDLDAQLVRKTLKERPEYWEESWRLEETCCHSDSSEKPSANGWWEKLYNNNYNNNESENESRPSRPRHH